MTRKIAPNHNELIDRKSARVKALFLSVLALSLMTCTAHAQSDGTLERRFKSFDRDGDGKVTREEARGVRWFDRLDRDGDGAITLDEVRGLNLRPARGSDATAHAHLATRLDVAYGEHNAQRLDIYAPKKADDAPVMVYVHGGGWRRGDKSAVGRKVEFFSGLGWVFVSVNYGLLPDGKHPRNAEDVAAALAWVHNHIAEDGGDPEKIFLMGHSAGAHLAALVATDERHLKAAQKDLAIVKGVIPLDTNAYDLPTLMQSRAARFYEQVFGDDPKVLRDASPLHHVAADKGIPPFLICYSRGMGETVNPARSEQAIAFAKTLKAAGVAAQVVDASDRNHGEINSRFGDPQDAKVTGKATVFLKALVAADRASVWTNEN